MPVDESSDINIAGNIKTLDDLDKAAQKAIKSLEKETKHVDNAKKELGKKDTLTSGDKTTGIFKDDTPSKKAEKGKVSFREELADQAGGTRGANFLFSMGKNPIGTTIGLLRSIPFLGGIVAFAEFGQAVFSELEKLDRFFKKFIPIIDNRINQLRKVVEQAHIRAGDTQLILTTEAGGTSPREAYNTFNEFNTNRTILENDFAVRDTSGV